MQFTKENAYKVIEYYCPILIGMPLLIYQGKIEKLSFREDKNEVGHIELCYLHPETESLYCNELDFFLTNKNIDKIYDINGSLLI